VPGAGAVVYDDPPGLGDVSGFDDALVAGGGAMVADGGADPASCRAA
jgi:hypothetical protein